MSGRAKQKAIYADIDKQADKVWEMVSEGRGKRPIAAALGVSVSSMGRWLQMHDEQRKALFGTAADSLAEEAMELADTATPQTATVAKLQVDTRFRMAKALNPQKYGDGPKVAIQVNVMEQFVEGLRNANKGVGWDGNGSPTE